MKILYCITGLGIGGAEAITIDLANKMVGLGHSVVLMYLTGQNQQSARIDKRLQIVGLDMAKTPLGFFNARKKAVRFMRKWQPDVVHAQMVHANLFCRVIRLSSQIPLLICTEHSKNIEGRFRMWMYRITDFLSDVNTNVSEEATRFFIRQKAFSVPKSKTVYNGIDLKKFTFSPKNGLKIRGRYGIQKDEFLFLSVGRLTPAKDQKNLITAFQSVSVFYSDVKLMIVGEGELKEELEQYIQKLSLEKQVILTGNQRNITDYYRAADCFVLSSAWEGFGIVLAEAMSCELPVIATDAGGCAEVVGDAEYIVEPHDTKALFGKMRQVYEMSNEKRRRVGKQNREKAKRFDIEDICRQWLALYSSRNIKQS